VYFVQYQMLDGSTHVPSFVFKTLEALVKWSQDPERLASWRLMGVAFVSPLEAP
jgi:hypothetical protein